MAELMDQIMLEHSSITQGPWDHSDSMLIFMMKSRFLTDAGESSFCAIFKRADVCEVAVCQQNLKIK